MKLHINNLLTIALSCNHFDYNGIVDNFERGNFNAEYWGYGYFQEYITILPNFAKVKEITKDIKPIAKGKYWLVFHAEDVTNEMRDKLDEEDFYLLDYITKTDFEKEGIC